MYAYLHIYLSTHISSFRRNAGEIRSLERKDKVTTDVPRHIFSTTKISTVIFGNHSRVNSTTAEPISKNKLKIPSTLRASINLHTHFPHRNRFKPIFNALLIQIAHAQHTYPIVHYNMEYAIIRGRLPRTSPCL